MPPKGPKLEPTLTVEYTYLSLQQHTSTCTQFYESSPMSFYSFNATDLPTLTSETELRRHQHQMAESFAVAVS